MSIVPNRGTHNAVRSTLVLLR